MTTIEEVVKQVETVFNDPQYPPTRTELEVLRKILRTIYVHHRQTREVQCLHAPFESQKSGVFRNAISNYMRHIEKHQRIHGVAITCRS